MRGKGLTSYLKTALGEEKFVLFTQAFGGTRVYVPHEMRPTTEIVRVIGMDAAERIGRALSPSTIRVPLARRERALFYRAQGLSNAQIARRLGITENGVIKLFKREADLPERPARSNNQRQLNLL